MILPASDAEQLWWKPCLTRETDSAREHCWFIAPTTYDSLYCWQCRTAMPHGARALRGKPKPIDPLTRKCNACGAPPGKGCNMTDKNGKQLPLVPRASRLVHANRLEGATTP